MLELKDKLEGLAVSPAAEQPQLATGAAVEDVLSAMVNLGYTRVAAQKAIESAIQTNGATDLTLRNDFEALFRLSMRLLR